MSSNKKVQNFNRTKSHRESMVRNQAVSLIHYEVINTTSAKAKVLKSYFDKMMSKAMKNDEVARRYINSLTNDKIAVKKLFDVLVPRYKGRTSGFVSVQKVGIRSGDSSEMSEVSLVDGKKVLHIMRDEGSKKKKRTKVKPETKPKAKSEPKRKDESRAKTAGKKESKSKKPEKKDSFTDRLGKFLGLKRDSNKVKPEDK